MIIQSGAIGISMAVGPRLSFQFSAAVSGPVHTARPSQ
ncbi:uncharacterized protein METZ01_LOCUS244153 [marine metagenome]|uniref:Uncharacterized protein n=1 Tax=marine metagenome TaxID=408172 RepID=A0A382HVT7_9ZZZZ